MSYLGRIIIGKSLDSRDVLYLRDERRDLKKRRYEAEGAQKYREAKKILRKKNGIKRAHQMVKNLTSEKQYTTTTTCIQDKAIKEQEILSSWTEYCSELYE